MKQNLVSIFLTAAFVVTAGSVWGGQAPQDPTDPFGQPPKKTVKPAAEAADANKPVLKPYPPLEQRQAEYLHEKQQARAKGLPEPNPIGQYLVKELRITGVFETENGIGAFVEATPTQTTFFVGPRTRVYNGEIVSINTGTDFNIGQVLFNERTVYVVGKGKKQKEQVQVTPVTMAVGAGASGGKKKT